MSITELNVKEDKQGVVMFRQWKIKWRYNYVGIHSTYILKTYLRV
jgi:hypothetical protein